MKIIIRLVWAVPILAVAVFVAEPATKVFAHNGTDHSNSSAGHNDTDDSMKTVGQKDANDVSAATSNTRLSLDDAKKDFYDHMRSRGAELLDQAKKAKKTELLSSADRTQNCESRKQGLDQKLANIVKNAQKYQTRVDNVFTKAQAYTTGNTVEISNWDALLVTATDAQTKAEASVDALGTLKTTVDCNSDTVASDVATFKAAVQQAREDLQAYRKSVKDLVAAIREAKEAATPTTNTNTSQEAN